MHDKFMTIREAAKALNFGLQWTYKLIWSGKLEAVKDERFGRWLISRKSVEAYKRTE